MTIKILKLPAVTFLTLIFGHYGCAVLHSAQLGDLEPIDQKNSQRISVKVSETTLDLREIAGLAKIGGDVFASRGLSSAGSAVDTYTAVFQFGPRTGTPVFNELYARFVPELLREKCPKGHLANIVSIRETRSYPVVKGEIVRIDADCINHN